MIDEKKLIDAEDVINLIKENWEITEKDFYAHPKAVEFGIGIAIRIIENFAILNGLSLEKFQAIKTSDKWMPCSKELPNKDGFYLASYHGDRDFVETALFQQGKFVGDCCEMIVAWMYLPDEYKGEEK